MEDIVYDIMCSFLDGCLALGVGADEGAPRPMHGQRESDPSVSQV